jgi:hypothetical protein
MRIFLLVGMTTYISSETSGETNSNDCINDSETLKLLRRSSRRQKIGSTESTTVTEEEEEASGGEEEDGDEPKKSVSLCKVEGGE